MKNPFTKVEVGSTVQPPNGTGLALLKLFRRDGGTSIVLPAEQAEYAALAINQHERLVAGLTMAMHALRSYQYGNSSDQLGRQAANQVEAILAAV